MRDPRLDRLADVLVRYSAGIKRGDLVVISGDPGAMESVEAVFTAVLKAGGHPSFRPVSENLRELLLRHGSDEQIRHLCPFNAQQLENCDVLMVLRHPVNSRYLGTVDPVKAAMANAARQARLPSGLKKLASGKQRYVLTEIPSHSAAQDAEMSLTDYADSVHRAGASASG